MNFSSFNNESDVIQALAAQHGVSPNAVSTMLEAVARGNGSQAQFSHPELGGMGQWMRGGMIMVGDMFNNHLKGKVDFLCNDLSDYVRNDRARLLPPPQVGNFGSAQGGNWWPGHLGWPSSSGGQNNLLYAYFPSSARLAILDNGFLSVYDTLNHSIGGFSQQQGSGVQSLSFSSQFGQFSVVSLPLAR